MLVTTNVFAKQGARPKTMNALYAESRHVTGRTNTVPTKLILIITGRCVGCAIRITTGRIGSKKNAVRNVSV